MRTEPPFAAFAFNDASMTGLLPTPPLAAMTGTTKMFFAQEYNTRVHAMAAVIVTTTTTISPFFVTSLLRLTDPSHRLP